MELFIEMLGNGMRAFTTICLMKKLALKTVTLIAARITEELLYWGLAITVKCRGVNL